MPALISSLTPFFTNDLPCRSVLALLKAAQKSSSETLKDPLRSKVFMALIEMEFSTLVYTDQDQLLIDFGVAPFAARSQSIIGLVSQSLNVPMTVATQVLGQYMGIHAEYAFEVFPATGERSVRWASPTDESLLPRQLIIDDECYVLEVIESQADFMGYVEQAICRYQNSAGTSFYLMAARTCGKDYYGRERPYLTIGRQAASAYLFDRVKIDKNSSATIILPLDFTVSLALRALTSDSRHINDSEVVVSGLIGGSSGLKFTELSPLAHHRIAIIPEFHRDGLLGVETAVALCRKAGAMDVRVYPWPLYESTLESATTAWAEEFQRHAVKLNEVDSPTCLVGKICQEALSPADFQRLLVDLRVVVAIDTITPALPDMASFPVKRLCELRKGDGDSVPNSPMLDRLFSIGQISLIWGSSNSGKSFVGLTIAIALASGTQAFAIENQGGPRQVLLVDGELDEAALRFRAEQLMQPLTNQSVALKNLVYCPTRELPSACYDVLQKEFADNICSCVKENQIQVVIIDNLITMAASATRGNDDALFALIRRIEHAGAAVILIHHATKDGDNFKGSSNLASKSQNIIHIEGRDALLEDEHCDEAVKAALQTDGAVVRLNWRKCKTAPVLEGSSSTFKLPLDGAWLPVTDTLNMAGVESIVLEVSTPEDDAAISTLTADEQKTIALFSDRHQHTRKEVETALSCGEDKAGSVLKALKDKKIIKDVGGGRNTAYVLA